GCSTRRVSPATLRPPTQRCEIGIRGSRGHRTSRSTGTTRSWRRNNCLELPYLAGVETLRGRDRGKPTHCPVLMQAHWPKTELKSCLAALGESVARLPRCLASICAEMRQHMGLREIRASLAGAARL